MLNEISTVVACAGFFAIAALAAARGGREPLAARLSVLCLALFAYTALDLPAQPLWQWLAGASAALVAPFFFHFVVTFLGQRSERAKWVVAAYAYFGALALACLSPFVSPSMAGFPNGAVWSALILAGLLPMAVAGVTLLVRHARTARAEERARTALVLACVLVAVSGAAADLAAIGLGRSHGWSSLAFVASAALLAVAALRSRLLARVSVLAAFTAAGLAAAVVLIELALYRGAGSRTALLAVGSAVVALLALFAGRYLAAATTEHRERARADELLGRMSRQMAHDLRNPLAAIRGAAEFLQVERERGRPLEAQGEYLDLLVELADRMARVIDQYQRLGRVEPEFAAVDLNALVSRAAKVVKCAVTRELHADLPLCQADADLITIAVENVLRNAEEALRDGGRITLRTTHSGDTVTLDVEDDGSGMDARTRDQAFDDFYTTKATGTGLGLAFVRRVVEAHDGRVALVSIEGSGTRVTMTLPTKGATRPADGDASARPNH